MAEHSTPPASPGDIGRRIALRRQELGLSREEAAARARMAPDHLRYVELEPTAAPQGAELQDLAAALDTSVSELSGSAESPLGRAQAAEGAELVMLSRKECWALLSTHGVGRVGVLMPEGLTILPVNYVVVDGAIAFRSYPGSTPAAVSGTRCAFEVDHVDDLLSQGWSVLIRGVARTVTDPAGVQHLVEHARTGPWAGGGRNLWLKITPGTVTGRRIVGG
ncbi:pyridoxamine 5'-phosphate oxidase family protein [Streptomyces sp. NPDC088732]|uniref:pyridoxamine 5'-phosphate oxidase family protein n=1 Tax=Streptomyces sp. NPDC088732 TaxID=3365879 RepID=UPI00381AB7AB